MKKNNNIILFFTKEDLPMSNKLQNLFPLLRTRQELLQEIHNHNHLLSLFQNWEQEHQEEFLDFCTDAKGVKMLYDSFFKEIMNPETTPERLEEFLSLVLKQKSDTGLKLELLQDYTLKLIFCCPNSKKSL